MLYEYLSTKKAVIPEKLKDENSYLVHQLPCVKRPKTESILKTYSAGMEDGSVLRSRE